METLKNIIKTIIADLQDVEGLKYIDKDWGQLSYDPPAVKYPCALVDVANVEYQPLQAPKEMADLDIYITVANLTLTPSSAQCKRKNDSFATLDLLERIHQKLHLTPNEKYAPLVRVRVEKELVDSGEEIYRLIYRTSYKVEPQANTTKVTIRPAIYASL